MSEPTRDLNRNDLLGAPELVLHREYVPALGGWVYLKASLSTYEIEEWEASNRREAVEADKRVLKPVLGVRARFLAKCVCDKAGALLFRPEDVEILLRKPNHWIGPLFEKAFELNTLSAKAVDDAKKNSSQTQTGGLVTGSPLDLLAEAGQSIPTNSSAV